MADVVAVGAEPISRPLHAGGRGAREGGEGERTSDIVDNMMTNKFGSQ